MRTLILQAPLLSASGYGQYAREIFRAVLTSTPYKVCGIPTMWGYSSEPLWEDDEFMRAVKLACTVRPEKGEKNMIYMQLALAKDFVAYDRCVNIGVTLGLESDYVPISYIEGANRMDALIVSSTYVRDRFQDGGCTKPIHVIGEGVDLNIFHPVEGRPPMPGLEAIDTPFNFFTGGQWWGNSPFEVDRKAIAETIAIFCDTFRDSKDVGLVVKAHTYNNSSSDEYLTAKKVTGLKGGREFPKVYLIHGRMTDTEMAALYNDGRIKAVVSPTHGEGWGRMIAEAIACDLPVIVTGWSGHMDFVDPKKSTVMPYKMVPVPASAYALYEPGMKWAAVNPADTKRYMLRAWKSYAGAVERAQALGKSFRARFSEEITRRELAQAIMHISGD